jgi:hypothetical protein
MQKDRVMLPDPNLVVSSVEETLLSPLRQGKAVVLRLDDPRLPLKRRAVAPHKLFLIPLGTLGVSSSGILAALPPYGSEIFFLDRVSMLVFLRLGINAALAEALANALEGLFQKT